MIITIDGPAGTGKSTVAKLLAEKLHFVYFDTGAMYRAFTWFLLKKKIDIEKSQAVKDALSIFTFAIKDVKKSKHYFVNENDVTKSIRTVKITNAVSIVSAYPFVRKYMVKIQQNFALNTNAVFEGRDMGTVVFPHAEMKIFLTADPEVRVQRRFLELKEKSGKKSLPPTVEDLAKQIHTRDTLDATREVSPLCKAKDAHEVDTTSLTASQVVDKIIRIKKKKKSSIFYRAILFFAKVFFKIFYRLEIQGQKNVPYKGAIIAPNHLSFLDPPLVAVSSPYPIHFLAKVALFKFRPFGWFIRKLNSHPVSANASDRKTIKTALDLLQKEEKILIFPEGSRGDTTEISTIKSGIAFLAYRSKAPIVPTYIVGTYKAWSKFRKFPKVFVKLRCIFGKPIYVNQDPGVSRQEVMNQLMEKTKQSLLDLQKTYEKDLKNTHKLDKK